MQKHSLGTFIWERGSINDNIRTLLSFKQLAWRNDHYGEPEVSCGGKYRRVRYGLVDEEKELYNVYVYC